MMQRSDLMISLPLPSQQVFFEYHVGALALA